MYARLHACMHVVKPVLILKADTLGLRLVSAAYFQGHLAQLAIPGRITKLPGKDALNRGVR